MPAAPDSTDPGGPGGDFVRAPGIAIAAVILILGGLLLLYGLIAFWPSPGTTNASPVPHRFFNLRFTLDHDRELFLIVSMAGGLGGIVHSLRSLYWYVGNRALRRSWILFYICTPLVGVILSVVFYLVLRGGLFSGQAAGADVNAYGFAAISSLVGLFSPEAIQKLKQIFTGIFAQAEEGRDHVGPT